MKRILMPCTRREMLGKAAKLVGAALIAPGMIQGKTEKTAVGYAPKLSVEVFSTRRLHGSALSALFVSKRESLSSFSFLRMSLGRTRR